MKKAITFMTTVSFAILLSACGGGSGGSGSSAGGGSSGGGDEDSKVTVTSDIVTTPDFDFPAARTVGIDVNLAAARTAEGTDSSGDNGMLSICTKYTSQTDGTFDIDYDSCTVQATLSDGAYAASMKLTNDVDTVVGVVWFADPAVPPVYKEFAVADAAAAQRVAADGGTDGRPMIIWH